MPVQRFITALRVQWRIVGLAVAVSVILGLGAMAAVQWVANSAATAARISAAERMRTNAGLFESELQKYRLLPAVLAESSDVISLVRSPTPEVAGQLNAKLSQLARQLGIEVVYVVDAGGTTLASSNFDLSTSFVGQNFAFRPYFQDAMAGRNGEYFARGAISRRPGFFFARAVADGRGVVVLKITFDKLEAEWAKQPGHTVVRDRDGVVTAASDTRWVLHGSRPLVSSPSGAAQRTQQFGAAMPTRLPFNLPAPPSLGGAEEGLVQLAKGRRYALASTPVSIANWTLSVLEPLEPAMEAATARARVIGLLAILILVVAIGLVTRSTERRRLLIASRQMLEDQVKVRTAELRGTNEQLKAEVAERERTGRRLRTAREELAQANRLGSIGQITAGVAHEINQPVAAIRTFAENAKILIEKADWAETRGNLDLIIELTSRIGRITNELRSFARREPPPIGLIRVGDALDGAMILVGDRLRTENVSLTMPEEGLAAITVRADRMRLEQVIVNLLQNSLDALAEVGNRRIEVRIDTQPRTKALLLVIDDSGPGIPSELRNSLFKPFVTGKKHGLGLGLGIAQDIVREFGGDLTLCDSILGGSAFCITLLKR